MQYSSVGRIATNEGRGKQQAACNQQNKQDQEQIKNGK